MASYRKRGPRQWQALVRKRGYPLQAKPFKTKAAAEAWVHALEYEMDQGLFVSRHEAETAMRRGELLALKWQFINLRHRTAYLPETKNGDSRTVPLSSVATEVLTALPRGITGDTFPGLTTMAVKKAFGRAVERAGLLDLHFRDLRHEATARLFERGLNIMEVAAITGRKDLRMLTRYTHLRAKDLAKKLA